MIQHYRSSAFCLGERKGAEGQGERAKGKGQ